MMTSSSRGEAMMVAEKSCCVCFGDGWETTAGSEIRGGGECEQARAAPPSRPVRKASLFNADGAPTLPLRRKSTTVRPPRTGAPVLPSRRESPSVTAGSFGVSAEVLAELQRLDIEQEEADEDAHQSSSDFPHADETPLQPKRRASGVAVKQRGRRRQVDTSSRRRQLSPLLLRVAARSA